MTGVERSRAIPETFLNNCGNMQWQNSGWGMLSLRSPSTRQWASLLGLALSLVLPSVLTVDKFLGHFALLCYAVIVPTWLIFFLRYYSVIERFLSSFGELPVIILASLTFVGIGIAFAIIYPIANSGAIGGGSDHDDALNIAVRELVDGRYPYYLKTYLGIPITPMPGSLLLALPFVLLGNSAYQNLFWLPVFYFGLRKHFQNSTSALLLFLVIFLLSPVAIHMVVIGSDYIANSAYLMLSVIWMIRSVSNPESGLWQRVLSAVAVGISFSSRFNFFLILLPLFATLVQMAGIRRTIPHMLIAGLTGLSITLPFFLYDPKGFSPLHTYGKLAQFESMIPHAGIVLSLLSIAVTVGVSFWNRRNSDTNAFLRKAAIILAFPVVVSVTLDALRNGSLLLGIYGTFFLFFGAVGFWSSATGWEALQRERKRY